MERGVVSRRLLVGVDPVRSHITILSGNILNRVCVRHRRGLNLINGVCLNAIIHILPNVRTTFISVNRSQATFLRIGSVRHRPHPITRGGGGVTRRHGGGPSTNASGAIMRGNVSNLRIDPPIIDTRDASIIPISGALVRRHLRRDRHVLMRIAGSRLNDGNTHLAAGISLPSHCLMCLPSDSRVNVSRHVSNRRRHGHLGARLGDLVRAIGLGNKLVTHATTRHIPISGLRRSVCCLLRL